MTDRFQIIYSPTAINDMRGIYSYIAFSLKEKTTAKKLISRIRQGIQELKTMPERYARVDWEPFYSMGVRSFSVGNYVIFYMTDVPNSTVRVIRVCYGGRDIEEIMNS